MKAYISLVAFCIILSTAGTAYADKRLAVNTNAQNCHMEENNNISFSMTGSESDIAKIKSLVDVKISEVKAIAADTGVTDFEIQNYSYNAYVNNNGSACAAATPPASLQYNANFSFLVKPADKAAELAKSLMSKGYNVSLNVNAYRQCQ